MIQGNDLFKLMFENHGTVMLIIDPNSGVILQANGAAERFYGYPPSILEGNTIFDLNVLPRGQVAEELALSVRQEKRHSIFPHKVAGGVRTVEIYSSCITSCGKTVLCSIIHDITPWQEIQDELVHKNNLYAVLSQTNQCIARAKDRAELFDAVCHIAVEYGGFKLAWIGLINGEAAILEPAASAGASAYLEEVVISLGSANSGPCAMACREGHYYVCNDFVSDCRPLPWRIKASEARIGSSAAFPLLLEGKTVGAYILCAEEVNYFTDTVVALLDGIAVDISYALDNFERKAQRDRAEAATREAVKRFELATTSAHLGVWDWDIRNGKVIWDDRMYELYGIREGDFSATLEGWQDLVHPDDRAEWRALFDNAVRKGEGFDHSFRIVLPSGSTRCIKADGIVIRDLGSATRMIGLNRDITESSCREARLQEYRKIIECSCDLVCMLDPGLRCQLANGVLLKYLGVTQADVLGHTVQEVFGAGKSAQLAHHLRRGFNGYAEDFEMVYEFPSLGERDLAVSCFPVSDERGGARVGCILRDMTERRRFENQLLHSQKMEAVGTLAGGVAHDFNNNLTVIMGYANLIKLIANEPERVAKMAEEIISSVERATAMTQRLLAFSRKQSLELRAENLNDIVAGLEKSLGRLIGEDIELQVTRSDERLPVMVDRVQIEQVILNLAVNARDAMPFGGSFMISTEQVDIDEEICSLHNINSPGSYAVITLADNGQGIEKGLQKRIFDPFFTTKEVGKGTGLGLSIVYGIVKTHNGFINLNSEPGRGTAFNIYLPLLSLHGEPCSEPAPETPVSGNETVLLVEDDKAIRDMTCAFLEKFGYTVLVAENGMEAIDLFRRESGSIQIIITDIIMPGINGREAYEEMIKIRPGTPTIFMSGYPADIINKKGFMGNGFDYLAKPLNPALLLKKIRDALARRGDGKPESGSRQEGP